MRGVHGVSALPLDPREASDGRTRGSGCTEGGGGEGAALRQNVDRGGRHLGHGHLDESQEAGDESTARQSPPPRGWMNAGGIFGWVMVWFAAFAASFGIGRPLIKKIENQLIIWV